MVITKTDIMNVLNCSEIYAQKIIDFAKGDKQKLENILYIKLAEREITPAIKEVK